MGIASAKGVFFYIHDAGRHAESTICSYTSNFISNRCIIIIGKNRSSSRTCRIPVIGIEHMGALRSIAKSKCNLFSAVVCNLLLISQSLSNPVDSDADSTVGSTQLLLHFGRSIRFHIVHSSRGILGAQRLINIGRIHQSTGRNIIVVDILIVDNTLNRVILFSEELIPILIGVTSTKGNSASLSVVNTSKINSFGQIPNLEVIVVVNHVDINIDLHVINVDIHGGLDCNLFLGGRTRLLPRVQIMLISVNTHLVGLGSIPNHIKVNAVSDVTELNVVCPPPILLNNRIHRDFLLKISYITLIVRASIHYLTCRGSYYCSFCLSHCFFRERNHSVST